MNYWASVKDKVGDMNVDQESQLLLHEVLHVLYSTELCAVDGHVNRDHVAQLLVDKFSHRSH